MKFPSLYKVELSRALRDPWTWLAAGLTALAPLAPLCEVSPLSFTLGDTMAARYLAEPMLTGGLVGTLLLALLTLITLSNPVRKGVTALTDAAVGPVTLSCARLLSIMSAAALTGLLAGLAYLPFIAYKLNIVFSLSDYLAALLLFLLPGQLFGALLAAAVWQITARADVSAVVILAAWCFTFAPVCDADFIVRWDLPLTPTMSDSFGNAIVWRTAFYSRAIWLCLLSGLWLLSLPCVREYGRGLIGSFARHARFIAVPIISLILIGCGAALWAGQPFSDHTPDNWMERMMSEPDRTNPVLSIERCDISVGVRDYLLGTIAGKGDYKISNSSGEPQELYFGLNSGLAVNKITANGNELPFYDLENDLIATRELRCTLPADADILLEIEYGGMPKMWNQAVQRLSAGVVSSDGASIEGKALSPQLSGCAPMPDDAPATLGITLKSGLVVTGSGTVTDSNENPDGTTRWRLEDAGTDAFLVYAGDYTEVMLDAGNGNSIPFYYSRKYQSRIGSSAADVMRSAIEYCTAQYGAKPDGFKIVQTSSFGFGGFATSNLSCMGETYFSDRNLSDPSKGASAAEVLAHEIIHQWWGLGAMLADPEDADWNDEGITVYTSYRIMRQLMGADYAEKNYVNKWRAEVSELNSSFYSQNPEYMKRLPERYQARIQNEASSINWYSGNALFIHNAALLIGEDKINEVWAELYSQGGTEMPPYITRGDFLAACGLREEDVSRD